VSDYPYPGLRPFRPDESDIFFGREEQSDQLLERLGSSHFLALIGTSGCGKSSLVHTGLVAGLQMGLLARAGVRWRIAEFRPGIKPLDALTKALLKFEVLGEVYGSNFSGEEEARAFLRAALGRGPRALIEILERGILSPNDNLLLLVDQFEELFRFRSPRQEEREEAAALVALLLESSGHPQVYVTIAMRSDFLGECAQFYGLPEAVNEGLFLVPRLTREQMRDAIVSPAEVFGGQIDPTVANRLLNDAGNTPDQLPLIQHCLMWMWSRAERGKRQPVVLSEMDYQKVGGLGEALSRHAEEAYSELNEAQQGIAPVLFKALTEWVGGRMDLRRPSRLAEVAKLAGVKWEEVAKVVEVFRRPGRSFLTPDASLPLTADTMIDISHESLIRQWDRLKRWSEEEAEWARQYRRLEDHARDWETGQASLLQSLDLENALKWQAEAEPTALWAQRYGGRFDLCMDFLETSNREARKKRWRRVRRTAYAVIGCGLLFLGFLVLANQKVQLLQRAGFDNLVAANNSTKDDDRRKAYQAAEDSFNKAIWWDIFPRLPWQSISTEFRLPPSHSLKNGLGQVYFNEGKLKAAEKEFKQAIEMAESEDHNQAPPEYYGGLIDCYLNLKNYQEVINISEEVMKNPNANNKDKGYACLGKGIALINSEKMDEAKKAFKAAIELYDPSDPMLLKDWLQKMANAYIDVGQYQQAIDNCKKLIGKTVAKKITLKLNRFDKARAYRTMGNAYVRQNQQNEAKSAYEKAIKYDPKITEVYINLGNIYSNRENYKQAIEYYKRFYRNAKQDDPQYPYGYVYLGLAYFGKGDRQEAEKNFHLAQQSSKSNPEIAKQSSFTNPMRALGNYLKGSGNSTQPPQGNRSE
jgi:tetratricopeptide (TPR) repeat protein